MNTKELDALCEKARGILEYGKPVSVVVKPTDYIASYRDQDAMILVDPEAVEFYEDKLKSIVLHEVCHAAEYDYAEKEGLRDDEDYMDEFSEKNGHTFVFEEFADAISEELNGGESVLYAEFKPISRPMDPRIKELCRQMEMNEKEVQCKLDYCDVSIPDEGCVIIRPKYYTGKDLDENAFQDIADSFAAYLGFDYDEAADIADDIFCKF